MTSKSKSKNREGREEKIIGKNQQRKKRKKTTHKGNTQACRLASSAGEIQHRDKRTESATKESREAKSEGDTRNKRKTTKRKRRGKRGTTKGKGKTKKKRKKARVYGRHYANYLGLNGGTHHDDNGHTQALIALIWVIKMRSLSQGESLNVVHKVRLLFLLFSFVFVGRVSLLWY